MTTTGSAWDWAGIAAFLSVLGGGLWTLLKSLRGGIVSREDTLNARERAHDEAIDRKLKDISADLERTHMKYAALLSALTVMIDHMITQTPFDPVLGTLADTLRSAFPAEAEIPAEMALLLLRLDTRPRIPANG